MKTPCIDHLLRSSLHSTSLPLLSQTLQLSFSFLISPSFCLLNPSLRCILVRNIKRTLHSLNLRTRKKAVHPFHSLNLRKGRKAVHHIAYGTTRKKSKRNFSPYKERKA
ncbi:hypothetical protein AMTRI_Chr11g155620 [Amborella trichopoda]